MTKNAPLPYNSHRFRIDSSARCAMPSRTAPSNALLGPLESKGSFPRVGAAPYFPPQVRLVPVFFGGRTRDRFVFSGPQSYRTHRMVSNTPDHHSTRDGARAHHFRTESRASRAHRTAQETTCRETGAYHERPTERQARQINAVLGHYPSCSSGRLSISTG